MPKKTLAHAVLREPGSVSLLELNTPRLTPTTQPKRGCRKLWDIPKRMHCPVIGTCLEADELRRILAREEPKISASDYQIHVNCVGGRSALVEHYRYLVSRSKRFCKQNGKTYVLLESAGVSAFAKALERVVN